MNIMKKRNRIQREGTFVGSTSDYGQVHNICEPIGVLNNTLGDTGIPVRHMTRLEFEKENIFCKMLTDIDKCFPEISVSKRSKMYGIIRKELYRLLYINNKALISQGSVLEVA